MADRYWNPAAAGNWGDTSSWAASDGGPTGQTVPTSSDNVFFTSTNVQNCTVNVAASCADLSFTGGTGYTGQFSGTSALDIYGSLTLNSGMNRTYTGAITFKATATGKTITLNTKTTASNVTFNGSGGGWTVQDNWDGGSSTWVLTAGTLDTNGKTITCGPFDASGSTTRTLTLGASTVNCSTWTVSPATNMTLNANTSQITCVGSFAGGALTYYNVSITSTSTPTITATNTFNNFTRTGGANKTSTMILANDQTINGTLTINGNSAINRLLVLSNTRGTSRTLTAATVSVTYADFQDITGAGAGSWNLSAITGNSGDCGGNSGITFTTGATQYYYKVSGNDNWSTAGNWYLGSGGTGGAGRVPLPQDTARFDGSSFGAASMTVTQDMPRIPATNWTGATNTPTWTTSTAASLFGSLTLISGMTLTASTQTYTFEGRSACTLTNATLTWAKSWTIDCAGGTLTIKDNLDIGAGTLTIVSGTFDAADSGGNHTVKCTKISSSVTTSRTITTGTGTWTITGTGANIWATSNTTNLTFNATGGTLIFDGASPALNFGTTGGNLTLPTVNFTNATPTVTITGSFTASACTITGSGTVDVSIGSWNVTTLTANSSTVSFSSNTAATITFNGQSFYNLTINKNAGVAVTFNDAASCGNVLTLTQGTITANNQNITCKQFSSSNTNTRVVTMGSGTWTLNGTGDVWDTTTTTGLTVTANTSTISITDTSATAKTFKGGGKTYSTITITGDNVTIAGSNTFTTMNLNNGGQTNGTIFTSSTTQTVTNFSTNGSAGSLAKITSSTGGTAATLSKSSGTIIEDYMNIQDSTATGGAKWYAGSHSTNVSGNTGWIFSDPSTFDSLLLVTD